MSASNAGAQLQEQSDNVTTQEQTEPEQDEAMKREEGTDEVSPAESSDPENSYQYTAQPGDSYSVLARKATQTYGIDNNVEMSGAQIVFVETNLTQAAGSIHLTEGQRVSIDKDNVKEWVEKASELTDNQKAAWDYYAQMADFNTNANGEAPREQ